MPGDIKKYKQHSRRDFLKTSGCLAGAAFFSNITACAGNTSAANEVPLYAHLWVYASRFPPNWDCTPILDEVFSELKYAGLQGVEMMEVHFRHNDVVQRLKDLVGKYSLPVTGMSYYGNMWNKAEGQKILEDVDMVTERLNAVGGNMLGITVGDAKHVKTEDELNTQGELLKKIIAICAKNKIEPNLHNHTFEVNNNMHDFKGIVSRVPELKLGPDLNWLVRGGVDPVWFIKTYGNNMVYMHIRDQDAKGVWTETVGEGVINFPAIAKALKEINYKGKAAIELAFDKPPVNPVKEDWKKSREYVKQVFGW